jgi:hypothetical protein
VWDCRQKYVDEQMEKRMGVKKADPSNARAGPMDPEQQLYVTPDELKVRTVMSRQWFLPPMLSSLCENLGDTRS